MHIATMPTIAIAVFLTLITDVTHMRAASSAKPPTAPAFITAPSMPAWGSAPTGFPTSVMASLVDVKPIPAPSDSNAPPPPKPATLAGWNQLPNETVRVNIVAPNVANQVSANEPRVW